MFLGRLDPNEKETYGFRSNKYSPAVEELAKFELDLMRMISNIKFRSVRNDFLSKLKNDIKTINSTQEILVKADKSSNSYKLSKHDYNKYMSENITKTYNKCNKTKVNQINYQAKAITEKLEIFDRVEKMQESEAFVTIKITKTIFQTHFHFD